MGRTGDDARGARDARANRRGALGRPVPGGRASARRVARVFARRGMPPLDAARPRQPAAIPRRRPRLRRQRERRWSAAGTLLPRDEWTRWADRIVETTQATALRDGAQAQLAGVRRAAGVRAAHARPVVPRCARPGHEPRRPAGLAARRPTRRRGRARLGRRTADQGPRPLPRHGGQRLRLSQALPAHRRRDVARPRAGIRNACDRAEASAMQTSTGCAAARSGPATSGSRSTCGIASTAPTTGPASIGKSPACKVERRRASRGPPGGAACVARSGRVATPTSEEDRMSITMYQASVPVFVRTLANLKGIAGEGGRARGGEEDRRVGAAQRPALSRTCSR